MDTIIQPIKKNAAAIAAAALIQPKIITKSKSTSNSSNTKVSKQKTTSQKFRIGFGTRSIIVSGSNSIKFGIHISESGRIEKYSENVLNINDVKIVTLISGIIAARIKAGNTHEEIVKQMRTAGCEGANSIRVFHNLIAKPPVITLANVPITDHYDTIDAE